MITTIVGPMYSRKSKRLLDEYRNMWNKDIILAFKPENDDRDNDEIKSKEYKETIQSIYINDLSEIKQYVFDKGAYTVFIDEAQFLKGDVSELVNLSVLYDIDFYIAGLNMTSEQHPFGIMGNILAVSDKTIHLTGNCSICNKPSYYSYYEKEDKVGDVLPGDDGYLSLCPNCLKKKKIQRKELLLRGMK